MTVFGTAGTADGLKLVKDAGADFVFNHRDSDYMEKIKVRVAQSAKLCALVIATSFQEALKGEGFDIILEMVASVNLSKDLLIVKNKGIITVRKCCLVLCCSWIMIDLFAVSGDRHQDSRRRNQPRDSIEQ